MQNRRRQKVIIGTLCAVIIGMVVGYAALSQILNIDGTSKVVGSFDIQFTKISENTMTGATTVSTSGIGLTTANFTVDLTKPGSSAIYDVTVENKGSIDAILKSIEGLNEANAASPTDIKFEVTGVDVNDELNAGQSKSFQVKVTWLGSSTSIPTTSKNLTLKLNYEQKASSSGGGSTISGASAYLIDNHLVNDVPAGENGLVAIDNTGAITTSTTPREYRYIGSNPDNYVSFNNELWRIIGIFDGQLKIARASILDTEMAWASNSENDWSRASLQTYLNEEYLNGIDTTSKDYILDYTWKLGAASDYRDPSNGLVQHFYGYERGTDKYEYGTRPLEWTGKIALMYPSDYGFATSGGSTTNRSSCLSKELYSWDWNTVSDCKNNSWLYDSTHYQWTLTPSSTGQAEGFQVISDGHVYYSYAVNIPLGVRPVLFLKSDIEISTGTGSDTDPFILQYNA